jgi:hypothetical protein
MGVTRLEVGYKTENDVPHTQLTRRPFPIRSALPIALSSVVTRMVSIRYLTHSTCTLTDSSDRHESSMPHFPIIAGKHGRDILERGG